MPARDKNLWSGASKAQWFASRYPGNIMPHPNTVVLHTTEGTGWPSYSGGAVAPTFTAKPDFTRRRLVWHQHFPANMSARALENHAGGVETNTLNVIQVEIVGTCDPSTHRRWGSIPHLYTEDMPAWAIRDLGKWLAWVHDTYPVPLTSDVTWTAYPQSYGPGGQRMSQSKWLNFNGVCGHQHVPENVHGDPGRFPADRLLAAAGGTTLADTNTPDPKEWYEMAELSDGIAREIRAIVHDEVNKVVAYQTQHDLLRCVGDTATPPRRFAGDDNKKWMLKSLATDAANSSASARDYAAGNRKLLEKIAEKSGLSADDVKAAVQQAIADLASADAEINVQIGDSK